MLHPACARGLVDVYIWLLVWLVYTLLLLTCRWWYIFHIYHLVYVFQLSPEEYQICSLHLPYIYCLYISLENWGLVVTYDSDFVSFFCADSDVFLPRWSCDWKILLQKRSMPHNSECYLSIFCLLGYHSNTYRPRGPN